MNSNGTSAIAYDGAAALPGIRSRFVAGVNGLDIHLLEAGFGEGRPCVVLLHGFPELAWSWRKVMGPLAAAGYHVIAPDQRGYGLTTGWDADYDGDLASYRPLNLVRDVLGLLFALGHRSAAMVVGHDFGARVAAACALARPEVFRSMVLMSAPYPGPPPIEPSVAEGPDIHAALAALDPPRKHYHWYYSTRPANNDMWHCAQGVHDFLRAYVHYKSADWKGNKPHPLKSWTAGELAKLPTYYVMELDKTMAETVAPEMPSQAQIDACQWLPDDALRVYSRAYERTGFQGGLNWYRCATTGAAEAVMRLYAGRTIDVPSAFISGSSDWGVRQTPGAFEKMQQEACTRMRACHLIDGAGHWVQQEQPEAVSKLIIDFLLAAQLTAKT
jgi:pimeloyl-ACP methyl ester carboxylesterase